MKPDAILTPHPKCLLTELEDGTGVLLHLDTKFYYTLNGTGVFLWKALAEGGCSAAALVERLTRAYEVDAESATQDVSALVTMLLEENLAVSGSA
jgi:hypothetical protein